MYKFHSSRQEKRCETWYLSKLMITFDLEFMFWSCRSTTWQNNYCKIKAPCNLHIFHGLELNLKNGQPIMIYHYKNICISKYSGVRTFCKGQGPQNWLPKYCRTWTNCQNFWKTRMQVDKNEDPAPWVPTTARYWSTRGSASKIYLVILSICLICLFLKLTLSSAKNRLDNIY